jgi:hypothetical protein
LIIEDSVISCLQKIAAEKSRRTNYNFISILDSGGWLPLEGIDAAVVINLISGECEEWSFDGPQVTYVHFEDVVIIKQAVDLALIVKIASVAVRITDIDNNVDVCFSQLFIDQFRESVVLRHGTVFVHCGEVTVEHRSERLLCY